MSGGGVDLVVNSKQRKLGKGRKGREEEEKRILENRNEGKGNGKEEKLN